MNNVTLKKKGIRASYLITQNIGPYSKPSTAIRIFEKVVEPILTYNCVVTCAFFPMTWTYEKFQQKIWSIGSELNKVILGFLRQVLCVGKKSCNIALHGETGKYPICIKIFSQIIKYWERLKKAEVSVLLKATADLNKTDKLSNKQSWLRIVEYLVKYTKITEGSGPDCSTNLTNVFKRKIRAQYDTWWSKEVENSGKLDFYKKHKKQFKFEPYLDNIAKNLRIPVTKLRISNHCFPVEILRYRKRRKKREERKCPICHLDETADENHYLLRCNNSEISAIRTNFFQKIKLEIPQFEHFSNINIIDYCLNMSDTNTQALIAKFIKNILNMYREETDMTKEPTKEPVKTRSGRTVKRPQKLNL